MFLHYRLFSLYANDLCVVTQWYYATETYRQQPNEFLDTWHWLLYQSPLTQSFITSQSDVNLPYFIRNVAFNIPYLNKFFWHFRWLSLGNEAITDDGLFFGAWSWKDYSCMTFPSRGKNYAKENQEFQRPEYFGNYFIFIYLIYRRHGFVSNMCFTI